MYEWLWIDGPTYFRRYATFIHPPFPHIQLKEDLWQVILWYEQLYDLKTPNFDEIDFLIAYTQASDGIGSVGFDLCSSMNRWKQRRLAGIPEDNPLVD